MSQLNCKIVGRCVDFIAQLRYNEIYQIEAERQTYEWEWRIWWNGRSFNDYSGGIFSFGAFFRNRMNVHFKNRLRFIVNSLAREKDTYVFLSAMLFYSLNRFMLKEVVALPVLSNILKYHFNDYCGAIAFIAYVNILITCSKYKNRKVCSLKAILPITFGISICWEGFAPLISNKSTADWLDVIAYIIGGISYWFLKRILEKKRRV